jgi:hypothetical protein
MYRVPRTKGGVEKKDRRRRHEPKLTPAELRRLMDYAVRFWRQSGRRRVRFRWDGRSYIVHASSMRMLVSTGSGRPLYCRWH